MEIIDRDGVVRYPRIDRYSRGGVFLYEVVLPENALERLVRFGIENLQKIDEHPISIRVDLYGTLILQGFPRLAFSRERAEFEAFEILYEFWIKTGLLLGIAESKTIERKEDVYQ